MENRMAEIQRRVGKYGKVTFRVRVRIAGRPQQSKSFERLTDAREWAVTRESAVREGQHFPIRGARRRTVADLIARYDDEILPAYSAKEQRERRSKLVWWKAELGADRPVVDIAPADISECRSRLARKGPSGRPTSPGTQNRYLTVLKHVFAKARREWQWVTDNPVVQVEARKEPRGRDRYLSTEERARLLTACRASSDPRLYSIVVVALGTGARRGELLALSWSDVDFQARRAVVLGKNGERRGLALAGQAFDELRQIGRVRRIGVASVFAAAHGRLAWFPEKEWRRALEAAEIENFRFHDLRHTFASYLAMSGATLAELAEALGHKTLAMVKRYAHLTEQHTSGVVERMTKKFLL
jgi:integrase